MSITEDIQTVFAKDAAARSTLEVILCYPGLHALWMHSISHFLWTHKLFLPTRLNSHISRFLNRRRDSSRCRIAEPECPTTETELNYANLPDRVKFMGLRQDYRIKA